MYKVRLSRVRVTIVAVENQ